MFKEGIVACIKAKGEVLREYNNVVLLPFGTEYSIYMKNLRQESAVINVSIDGQDALNGDQLVIRGGSNLDLERFLETLDKGHRFKFIEKTQKISEHRGNNPEDGLVKIEYQFERRKSYVKSFDDFTIPCRSFSPSCGDAGTVTYSSVNLDGITAHGSVSNQHFQSVNVGELEPEKYTIILQLKGSLPHTPVEEVVTVRNKLACSICGTQNRSNLKYCGECGNCLIEL